LTKGVLSTHSLRGRASAICPITQSLLAGVAKRKRLSVATEMSRSSGLVSG
jgi:hypothetical protein